MRPRHRHLLSHLVPEAADRSPDAPAVVDDGNTLDAATLAERVGRLAAALRANGVGDGDRVMVFAPKSETTYAAVHAVLHAGAVVVPVNPRSGPEHLKSLIRLVEPAAVVLDASTAPRWPAGVDTVAIGHSTGARSVSWAEVTATDPIGPRRRTGDDPAYLITTSGSTGTPKCIVHTHRSGLRYAELSADCYGLRPDDRMASVAPFHFDQSTFELYAGPLAGAAVVLVSERMLLFPATVARLLREEEITVWYSVPTILRQLLDRGGVAADDVRRLRWVLFGGELFPAADLRAWMELAPQARFSNAYGPAEVNQCTFHHLDEPPAPGESIPIGRAWDDTRCRIAPTGADPDLGELLVESATTMAGYWRRPDLTEAAFTVETDDGGLPRRWYRTGDLVSRDGDGRLHFRGRLDRQVKVRGVRIELEAVETAIDAIDGVRASAAGITPSGALAVLVETPDLDERTLRGAIRAGAAPGADPEHVVIVDALPRTGSGKIDHGAAQARFDALDPTP